MAAAVEKHYLLGEFRLEPETRRLSRGHARVHLPNRPFQVFLYLIEHRERLVTRRELLDRFWEGHSVYDETLTKCVGAIRKALDDQSERPRFIETRWGEGYRYVGPVEERLTRHDPPVVEVERLRGVKIVIHEEEDTQTEHHSEAPRDVQTTVEPSGSPKAMLGRRALAAAVTLLAGLALVVTALMWQRSGPSPAETPSPPVRSLAVLPLQNLTKDRKSVV